MNNYLLIPALLFSLNIRAQNQIDFDYDSAGNQTLRNLICVNCNVPSAGRIGSSPEPSDFVQSTEYNDVKYYPNPVSENLYIEWKNVEGIVLKQIQVYSQNGQFILAKDNLENVETTSINFQSLAEGTYIALLEYSNSENKTLRIIKK